MRRLQVTRELAPLTYPLTNCSPARPVSQMCFTAWRLFTEDAIRAGDHASEHHRFAARRALRRLWLRAAQRLRREAAIEATIRERVHARLRQAALTKWWGKVQVRAPSFSSSSSSSALRQSWRWFSRLSVLTGAGQEAQRS